MLLQLLLLAARHAFSTDVRFVAVVGGESTGRRNVGRGGVVGGDVAGVRGERVVVDGGRGDSCFVGSLVLRMGELVVVRRGESRKEELCDNKGKRRSRD